MKSRLILLVLAAHAAGAMAQYKCTAANGAITFQQTPCFGARSQERLTVIPNGHPPLASSAAAAAAASVSVDQVMLARYERQHQREALVQAVKSAQDEKARRAEQRQADIAAARKQFGDDPANARALREALAAIDQRYDTLAGIDDSHVRAAQADLDNWDKPPAR